MAPLPAHRLVTYCDVGGRWRCRVLARNHRVVFASEQGFRSKRRAQRKARRAYPDAVDWPRPNDDA